MRKHKLGIYEKALPKNISWQDRLSIAKVCGFDFVEMSIDETDERLARLDWSKKERAKLVKTIINTGVTIPSMCLSGHRRFPFGSCDEATRQKAYEIMEKAIQLAVDLGIRTIQLAGYDVYYEEQDEGTIQRFQQGLEWAVELAASNQVTIAVEIMDTQFMSSISRWKKMGRDHQITVVHRVSRFRQPLSVERQRSGRAETRHRQNLCHSLKRHLQSD